VGLTTQGQAVAIRTLRNARETSQRGGVPFRLPGSLRARRTDSCTVEVPWENVLRLSALVLAVPHREFLRRSAAELLAPLRRGGAFLDLKSAVEAQKARPDTQYWSL